MGRRCPTILHYQQGNRDDSLALLDQCVGAMRDKDSRRRLAELFTALLTGDRASTVAPGARPQVARLNDAILLERDQDVQFDDDDDPVTPPAGGLCAQMKQLELPRNPAMLFNLAKCAESEGRLGDAIRLLTDYNQAAPAALDADEVQARLILLRSLVALPDPKGSMVRAFYTSAARHVEARAYDQAVADYQKADEVIPEFGESKRRVATILEAQGQIERARTYWRQVALAETGDERRQQTQLLVASFDAQRALTLPVSFYGAVFYKAGDPKKRAQQVWTTNGSSTARC